MADAKLKLDSTRTAKRALYAKAGVVAVAPAISHSHAAVAAFVAQIAKQVGKPARDAKIKITLRHIYRQRSRPGHGLDVAVAAKAIDAAIDDPAAPRVLHQPLTPPAREGQRQRPGARLQHRASRSTRRTSSCACSRA